MMAKRILVRVPKVDGLTHYRRAGLSLARGGDNIVEVDDRQLAILQADPLVAVGEAPKEAPKADPKKEDPKK
jgi:hypothetical protein